LIKKKQSMF